MARKFNTNIDLLLNQILNAKLQVLAADPASPQEGQFWYNSTLQKFKYRDATTVLTVLDSTSLAAYALLASPGFTGNPTAPTPAPGDNDTSIATTAFVGAAITALIGTAPGVLDTLGELSDALNDDANFSATITALIATKAGKFGVLIGNGALTSIAVVHSLGTRDVVVSVHDATTFEEVECDVTKTSTTTVTLGFAVAPTTNQYRAVVIG